MSLRAFTQVQVYEKPPNPKDKDKSNIHSLECYGRNVYLGTKDSVVQHLILPDGTEAGTEPSWKTRDGRTRKLGSSSSPVAQLGAVPVLNQLLVLWERSLCALNMFSLEPIASLKRIQHVSLFRVCESSALSARSRDVCVELVAASTRRRQVKIFVVGVDRWECVREVGLPQDPVALAVDGSSLCVATSDRYLLHDYSTGSRVDLFPHNLDRQNVIVSNAGEGEFLLNGPGCLGVFVMKTGVCQRPPLPWPEGVLSAGLCFPYILALRPPGLHVYSLLDQQLKQTLSLHGAKGLVSTTDGVFVFTEREVVLLSMVPLDQQIQALLGCEKVEEALALLDGAQHHLPQDSYQELQKSITCLAGFVRFHQEAFSEARDLFIKGELDPREIIRLFPDMEPLCQAFPSPLAPPGPALADLAASWRDDGAMFQRYRGFLGDFLRAVRGAEPGRRCAAAVDGALLRLYAAQGAAEEELVLLVTAPNACSLDTCRPVLQRHQRFFTLGLLYQSHGENMNAIQTWVGIADGQYEDSSCPDVYEHIIKSLCRSHSDVVWTFADWVVQRDQEVGVQIFTDREPDEHALLEEDILIFLKTYPLALVLYLEFLVHQQESQDEKHHSALALAYVSRILQDLQQGAGADARVGETRERLQQLLWQSTLYDAAAVHGSLQPTGLHAEKAVLLGRAGDHLGALDMLVYEAGDLQAAGAYCRRAARGLPRELQEGLYLHLLHIYLGPAHSATVAAADLLNANAAAFDPRSVLRALPESWSLQLVSRFLLDSLRGASHQRRMGGVQRGLAWAELLRQKYTWTQASRGMLRVGRGRTCATCRRGLTEPQFVCSLQGELTHTSCGSGHDGS